MSGRSASRSMVRTLRYRVLLVVAAAMVLLGAASVAGIRIVTDLNAERQVRIAAQSITTWGAEDDGVRVIRGADLTVVDTASTVVALMTGDAQVVVATADPPLTVSELESIAEALDDGGTMRWDAGSRTILFTEVRLADDVVFDGDERAPVDAALVGIGVEGSDRLVRAVALATAGILAAVIVAVGAVVTAVVSRTTRSLSELARTVERDALEELQRPSTVEYAETRAIAAAIGRLDERRGATERQLRDFVADVSHELRTPLTKIQGWSELYFQGAATTPSVDRAFQSIVDESERMRLLVDRLSQLARAEAGAESHEVVDLVAICRESAEDAALMAADATVRMAPADPALVLGDAAALTQVVRNLVGNALVHGGPGVTITVSVTTAGGTVELNVADDGVGMPNGLRDRAFERFVTGDRRNGTGLGLAIVNAIVLGHGGTVGLESEPGMGTRVTVRLPAATR